MGDTITPHSKRAGSMQNGYFPLFYFAISSAKMVFKGFPFGAQLCRAKCSALYLLARPAGKMSVLTGRKRSFSLVGKRTVFADGNVQKPGRFREWQEGYKSLREQSTYLLIYMLFILVKLILIIWRFTIIAIYQFKRNAIIANFTCVR